MPAKAGKSPLNLTVKDAVHSELEKFTIEYDPFGKGEIAVVLLEYGIRHAKKAMREHLAIAEGKFVDADDEALNGGGNLVGLPPQSARK